mmetsp:Transcript_82752/g.208289  ORF Transcript_82752/g.208289 Transcript_82752/m.208289 type:complete len:236 (+) Transcript_82752:793-1500(+)
MAAPWEGASSASIPAPAEPSSWMRQLPQRRAPKAHEDRGLSPPLCHPPHGTGTLLASRSMGRRRRRCAKPSGRATTARPAVSNAAVVPTVLHARLLRVQPQVPSTAQAAQESGQRLQARPAAGRMAAGAAAQMAQGRGSVGVARQQQRLRLRPADGAGSGGAAVAPLGTGSPNSDVISPPSHRTTSRKLQVVQPGVLARAGQLAAVPAELWRRAPELGRKHRLGRRRPPCRWRRR